MNGITFTNTDGTPTDLNYTLRGAAVALVFVLFALYFVANPTSWSALGNAQEQQNQKQQQTTTSQTISDPNERQV